MPTQPSPSIRIAVVEDNVDNADLICSLLELDFGVDQARHWAAGEAFLTEWDAAQPPALVLLDLQLPHFDGYAVLARLRQLPGGSIPRVIAVSANVLSTDVEEARTAGFDGFLGKPLKVHRFPDQIARILAGESIWEVR